MIYRLTFILILIISLEACDDPNDDAIKYDMVQINAAFVSAEQISDLRSLVIAQGDKIMKEAYYNGTSSAAIANFDVRSVTKSITATLIGIAIDQGFIDNVNQTIGELLTLYHEPLDSMIQAVTLHQLLSMSSGMDWREIGVPSEFPDWMSAPNQLDYALDKPFVGAPGTAFIYSDGGAHIVAAILESTTNMKPTAFAREHLFEPLGIGSRNWLVDKQGHNIGGAGLSIGPADMIKIGQLYLHKGKFDGEQVVSRSWIKTATAPHIDTGNILPFLDDYGYFWWLGNAHEVDYYVALGYGGQFILVAPERELIAVATCNWRVPTAQANNNWYNILELIIDQIIPATGE
ncbi:serine hydrolase domain-containing protein [Candidatus Neomarinimicrobiota bacterium]